MKVIGLDEKGVIYMDKPNHSTLFVAVPARSLSSGKIAAFFLEAKLLAHRTYIHAGSGIFSKEKRSATYSLSHTYFFSLAPCYVVTDVNQKICQCMMLSSHVFCCRLDGSPCLLLWLTDISHDMIFCWVTFNFAKHHRNFLCWVYSAGWIYIYTHNYAENKLPFLRRNMEKNMVFFPC